MSPTWIRPLSSPEAYVPCSGITATQLISTTASGKTRSVTPAAVHAGYGSTRNPEATRRRTSSHLSYLRLGVGGEDTTTWFFDVFGPDRVNVHAAQLDQALAQPPSRPATTFPEFESEMRGIFPATWTAGPPALTYCADSVRSFLFLSPLWKTVNLIGEVESCQIRGAPGHRRASRRPLSVLMGV